jgi:hypothetical protein
MPPERESSGRRINQRRRFLVRTVGAGAGRGASAVLASVWGMARTDRHHHGAYLVSLLDLIGVKDVERP